MSDEPRLRGELKSVLGEIYNDLGRSAEAEAAEIAAASDLEAGGGDATLIAMSERERARAETDLERDDDAARYSASATARLRAAGAPPTEMARSLQMQATIEVSRHHFADARRFIDEAQVFARQPGVPPELLARCLGTASVVVWALHDTEGGAVLVREQIAVLRASAGENDPSVAVAEAELADIIELTHPREAVELDRHALRVLEPALGPSDQRVINVKSRALPRMGWYGRYDEAEQRAREAESAIAASPTPNDLERQQLLNMWGQLEFLRRDYAAAERKINELITLQERRFGKGSTIGDSQLFFRAFLRGLQGHVEEASRELDAIAIRHTRNGRPLPSNWLLMQGVIDSRHGDYAKAEKELREALARDQNMSPQGSVWSANCKSALGAVLTKLARDDEAERLLHEASDLENRLFGESVPEHARTLINLARLLARHPERSAERRAVATEAAQTLERSLGPQDAEVIEAKALVQADSP